MSFNFELILFYAMVITGVVALFDKIFFAKNRKKRHAKLPILIDYAYSFFPVLVVVFFLRSFLYEPYRIPSGSLEPTLLMGDFILVNKFDYGVRLPVIHKKIMEMSEPERGDIIIFRWPPKPSIVFIKRVIGLPGDKISYINKQLYINDKKISQDFLKTSLSEEGDGVSAVVDEKLEDLMGVKHHIFLDAKKLSRDYQDVIVPPGMYFVMGDNRDDSADSRYWGFVPEQNIIGKAVGIWMSWNNETYGLRWNRIGTAIH